MSEAATDVVTPRARSLVLRSTVDPNYTKIVYRGEQLTLVRQRADGDIEVEYLQNRWRVPGDAVEPLPAPGELIASSPSMQGSVGAAVGVPARRHGTGSRVRYAVIATAVVAVTVVCGLILFAATRGNGGGAAVRNLAPAATPAEGTPMLPAAPTVIRTATSVPALRDGEAASSSPTSAPPSATPSSSPTAAATATPTPAASPVPPSVAAFTVCDRTVDCGVSEGRHSRTEVLVCMRAAGGASMAAIVLVATRETEPPRSAESPSVVARSMAVTPNPVFTCYPVRSVGGDLPDGRYTMWALAGSTVVARGSFVIGP